MPFSEIYTLPIYHKIRKEYMDFSHAYHNMILQIPKHIYRKRASVFTSRKGSVTVEASLLIPLFFFAVICLFALFEMESIKLTVRSGLQCVGQETAYKDYEKGLYVPLTMAEELTKVIGEERLERSWIVDGSSGISCLRSYRNAASHEYTFTAEYQIRMPFSVFGVPPVRQEISLRIKGWNGYQNPGASANNDEIVYITENGEVYHRDYHCTYLDLSIHASSLGAIGDRRNRYQEKYRPCEYCGAMAAGTVYITDMGNRYHSSLGCSGLKRQVRSVSIQNVGGRRPCSRCGY